MRKLYALCAVPLFQQCPLTFNLSAAISNTTTAWPLSTPAPARIPSSVTTDPVCLPPLQVCWLPYATSSIVLLLREISVASWASGSAAFVCAGFTAASPQVIATSIAITQHVALVSYQICRVIAACACSKIQGVSWSASEEPQCGRPGRLSESRSTLLPNRISTYATLPTWASAISHWTRSGNDRYPSARLARVVVCLRAANTHDWCDRDTNQLQLRPRSKGFCSPQHRAGKLAFF